MNKLFYVPIEPLDERYSSQWYRQFPIEFKKAKLNVEVIDGEVLTDVIEVGSFLDVNSSAYYKSEQLKRIALLFYERKINNGDKFFFGDIEFNGIETVKYLADLQNIKIQLYGFLHAGSYTKEDFMQKATPYAKYFELGWLKIFDKIFVGTQYHKDAVYNRRIMPFANELDKKELHDKIIVTGNPIFKSEYKVCSTVKKKNQIIISNRFDYEKRPNLSLDFAYMIKKRIPDVNIIITTGRPVFRSNKDWLIEYAKELEKDGIVTIYSGLSKSEYHTFLAESKVMLTNTIEENFGYCVVEACFYNTYPLCPNDYSHPELLNNDDRLLFNDEDEILDKLEYLLNRNFSVEHYAIHYFSSIKRICKELS